MHDPQVHDVARYLLGSLVSEEKVTSLADHIQDAAEDWMRDVEEMTKAEAE